MKKYFIITAGLILVLATGAWAHEHDEFNIGGKNYHISIGSLNEPLIVDDKSGLELEVVQASGVAVAGLEKTLKVEMSAGDQKKTMDLRPAYGQAGSYTTTFYPTVQTTFTYRLFGTINNVPVDLSFTCNPAGHAQMPDDTSVVKLSDQVSRTEKSGAFGCAEAKADYGFPEAAVGGAQVNAKIQALEEKTQANGGAKWLGIIGIVLGALALVAIRRK